VAITITVLCMQSNLLSSSVVKEYIILLETQLMCHPATMSLSVCTFVCLIHYVVCWRCHLSTLLSVKPCLCRDVECLRLCTTELSQRCQSTQIFGYCDICSSSLYVSHQTNQIESMQTTERRKLTGFLVTVMSVIFKNTDFCPCMDECVPSTVHTSSLLTAGDTDRRRAIS